MSTVYVTQDPISLEDFYAQAEVAGWTKGTNDEGQAFISDGKNYIFDVGESITEDGSKHVGFTCYAGNYPDLLEDEIMLWNEHEEGFWDLFPADEDEDQQLTSSEG